MAQTNHVLNSSSIDPEAYSEPPVKLYENSFMKKAFYENSALLKVVSLMPSIGIRCVFHNYQYGMYELKKTKQIVNKTETERSTTYNINSNDIKKNK